MILICHANVVLQSLHLRIGGGGGGGRCHVSVSVRGLSFDKRLVLQSAWFCVGSSHDTVHISTNPLFKPTTILEHQLGGQNSNAILSTGLGLQHLVRFKTPTAEGTALACFQSGSLHYARSETEEITEFACNKTSRSFTRGREST